MKAERRESGSNLVHSISALHVKTESIKNLTNFNFQ